MFLWTLQLTKFAVLYTIGSILSIGRYGAQLSNMPTRALMQQQQQQQQQQLLPGECITHIGAVLQRSTANFSKHAAREAELATGVVCCCQQRVS
jgi:hypothetical protein